MADNFSDIRTKVSAREHGVLSAVSQATGRDIAEIVRDLIVKWADAEVHRASVVTAVMRGEGLDANNGERRGKDP